MEESKEEGRPESSEVPSEETPDIVDLVESPKLGNQGLLNNLFNRIGGIFSSKNGTEEQETESQGEPPLSDARNQSSTRDEVGSYTAAAAS